jgi:hypothetical protein
VGKEALAVGAVGGHLLLVLADKQRQSSRHIEQGLGKDDQQQAAHVGQTGG